MNRWNGVGMSWWAGRWQSVLESFGWSSRLHSGLRYAREGRVKRLTVDSGLVMAEVHGRQAQPYQVTIQMNLLTVDEWDIVIRRLLSRPAFMATLLSGEMPMHIDEAFSGAHLSLFPTSQSDLHMSCSCPDWASPCKHIAAVYYTLGQRFDADPFLIFNLRGMSKSQMMERLREHWAKVEDVVDDWESAIDLELVVDAESVEDPLAVEDRAQVVQEGDSTTQFLVQSALHGTFWTMGQAVPTMERLRMDQNVVPRTLPMVWGPPHFMNNLSPKAGRELVSLMADILQSASTKARQAIERDLTKG